MKKIQPLRDDVRLIEIESLEEGEPRSLSLVVPPEEITPLPTEDLRFDLRGLSPYAPWAQAHRLMATTMIKETGLLSAARFGRINLEAYQIAPTLRLLAKPHMSLLIADDVGLGKTIEAGLAMLELIARGRTKRILIVTPPGLLDQWNDELYEKFGLDFTVIENQAGLLRVQTGLPSGVSPWDVLPRILTSMDYIKKETIRNRALRKRWDLIIVDEAHALAESGTPMNPYQTQRTRLGMALREASRSLLLLTATPHNGYIHSFRSLIELVEPTAATFHGSKESIHRRIEKSMIRRMKAQIKRRLQDGSEEDVFPARFVKGIPVPSDEKTMQLLHKVASYCSKTTRASREEEDADLVAFAMQIVKKRALSSRFALEKTIEHRLEALKKEEARQERPSPSEIRDLQAGLPLGDAAAERTAQRILRSAIPRDERRRRNEIRALNSIRKLLRSLTQTDQKIQTLVKELEKLFAANPSEKVIVFTEYLDTLHSIRDIFNTITSLNERFCILRGGLSRRQRIRIQEIFEQPDTRVLLATDAASEGLNLQRSCHRVIHFELPWNPNRLEQRNGRVDRYGQTHSPEIRYLYYPGSAEEDVLHRLIEKIEQIRMDRVSTPDILGVLIGAGELESGLVDLDPESAELEEAKRSLVQHFEDRTAEFVHNVQPLLSTGDSQKKEIEELLDLLDTATPLMPNDLELEILVRDILGSESMAPTKDTGIFQIQVPLAYRGPEVKAFYPSATFRRQVASHHRADEVEFITPLHPLIQAMSEEVRRRFLYVYPEERGLPVRRLAALQIEETEPVSILFTFYGRVQGGGGLLEECLIPIRIGRDGKILGKPEQNICFLFYRKRMGDTSTEAIEKLFGSIFDHLSSLALESATHYLNERAEALSHERKTQAEILRAELNKDLEDRLQEIDEEEKRSRGLVEKETGQRLLSFFEKAPSRGFQTRRAVVLNQIEERKKEIELFEKIEAPLPPKPLGALFLIPESESENTSYLEKD
ncbi:MAG: helicase-related protein [Acidobacteriota bacterium]